jgi:hypothetical protein
MRETRTSGSVGAPGEQLPGATRTSERPTSGRFGVSAETRNVVRLVPSPMAISVLIGTTLEGSARDRDARGVRGAWPG